MSRDIRTTLMLNINPSFELHVKISRIMLYKIFAIFLYYIYILLILFIDACSTALIDNTELANFITFKERRVICFL